MKEPYSEGPASHAGPESCADGRKAGREALAGVCAGRVLSLEKIVVRGADAIFTGRKATPGSSSRQEGYGPRVVGDLEHAQNHLMREPGGPRSTQADGDLGRVGKSKDESQR